MADGFVLRYRTENVDDGLPAGEGVFLACSFWMVSALKHAGTRTTMHRRLFDRLLTLRNDVGLLAEEYDPRAKRQLGNFPASAFAHFADQCRFRIQSRQQPGQQRAESSPAQGRQVLAYSS